jgi:hypothetical protein
MKRTSMYDGSKDDYIDGNFAHQSCCQQQFSQTELKWLSTQLDYLTVISILGE